MRIKSLIGLVLMLFVFSSSLKAFNLVSHDTIRPVICFDSVFTYNGDTLYRPNPNEAVDSTTHRTLHDTLIVGTDTTFTTLFLTIHPVRQVLIFVNLCRYDSLLYEGAYHTAPDSIIHPAVTVHGCDSSEKIYFQLYDSLFRADWRLSTDSNEWVSDSLIEGCTPFRLYGINQSVGASSIQWIFDDGDKSTDDNISHPYEPGTYQPMLIATSPDGCLDTASLSHPITIFQSPSAHFLCDPLHPSDAQPVATLYNLSSPIDTNSHFKWLFQKAVGSDEQDSSLEVSPVHTWNVGTLNDSANMAVTLIAYHDNLAPSGNIVTCTDTLYDTITLFTDILKFPNLVTPNGDGHNDRFVIVNLIEFQRYPVNRLIIYDRWGHPVYDVENITRDDQFWDPADTRSPDGTYFFVFIGRGESDDYSVRRQGAIEVIGSGKK